MLQNRVTLEIARLGQLGDGIAPGPVFVPRTLPGEIVDGLITDNRLDSPRILRPSPDRVSAPCRHYSSCGGCALQHASDSFVADWKIGVVRAALKARGLSSPIRRLHVSPPASRRRATFSARRTKKAVSIGFHPEGSNDIRDVPDCTVVRPALSNVRSVLERLVVLGASRRGQLRISVTETETGLDVSVRDGKQADIELRSSLIAAIRETPIIRLTWNSETLISVEAPRITFGATRVLLPPDCFLQATREGEAALLASVEDSLSSIDGQVVDLFSGLGTFSLPLSQVFEVHSVEGDATMLGALHEAWRKGKGLRKITVENRDLFRRPLIAEELKGFAGAVIDPPRAGAEAQIGELASSSVRVVAMVSCNPVTFARDAEMLIGAGYKCEWIDVVDQFRWSPHIEVVAKFSLDRD